MSRRRRLAYVAAAVAVLALAMAVPAAAKTVTTGTPQGWAGGVCRGVGAVADKVAGLLGMQPSDIAKERAEGKSLADIAKEKGVSQDKLVSTVVEARRQALQQAVADGQITQAQADSMLQRMKSNIEQGVTDPTTGAGCGAGQAGSGCGGMAGGACGGPAGATTGNSL